MYIYIYMCIYINALIARITLNPEPWTPSSKPPTLNPKHSTLHTKD